MYNTAVLISPNGQLEDIHRKVHIPGEEKHYFFPGDKIEVFKTSVGKVGLMICYDLWFPEICRIQALKGAEIFCAPFNTSFIASPPNMLEFIPATRVLENRVYVLACNRVGQFGKTVFLGGSAIA